MAYASKYYDPVKAHEYYMRTRELRKRTSTSGLTDEGKQAAKFVKQQLTEERNNVLQKLKDVMKDRIKELRERIKGISKGSAKDKAKERIRAEINNLREQYKTDKQSIKDDYQNKYVSELEGIRGSYTKQPKAKAAKKKKAAKSSSISVSGLYGGKTISK